MRRLMLVAAAAATVFIAGAAMAPRAQAMTLPDAGHLAGAVSQNSLKEDVALVCRRVWNGYRWVRQCWRTGPPVYYGFGPPPPPRWRHRPRVYYW